MKIYIFTSLLVLTLNLLSDEEVSSEIVLPELGDRVSGAVSSAQERAIGEMFLKQIYFQAPLWNVPCGFASWRPYTIEMFVGKDG